jgi:hypothetical protein
VREWWLRTLLVLTSPRAVFVALRDDKPDDLSSREEPILLIVLLVGIAFVLSTPTAAHLLNDNDYDGLLVAVWTFLAGGLYGAVAYFVLGAVLYWAGYALGSQGSFRRARQVLAFAGVPIALSLALWPVKLALYGGDLFRSGGADSHGSAKIFVALWLGFVLWSAYLLVLGIRAVHGWGWSRAALAAAAPIALTALVLIA